MCNRARLLHDSSIAVKNKRDEQFLECQSVNTDAKGRFSMDDFVLDPDPHLSEGDKARRDVSIRAALCVFVLITDELMSVFVIFRMFWQGKGMIK